MWVRRMDGAAAALGIVVLAAAVATAPPARAGEAGGASAAPAVLRVADLDWLVGAWRGSVGGQAVEEHWSAPEGGEMIGMFRWDRASPIYELLVLEDSPRGAVMRLRHFGPGLVAWEEKDAALVFRATDHGPCWALFTEERDDEEQTRLRYRRDADGGLLVELLELRDGAESVLAFPYRPVASPAVPGCG